MNVYRIGVDLVLATNAASVLAALSRNLMHANTQVRAINNNFRQMSLLIGGTTGIMAGGAILRGMKDIVKHGNEIVHQQTLMKTLGMSNLEIQNATAEAYRTSARIQTTNVAENLQHLRELRYAFGDITTAQQYLEPVSKAQAILSAVTAKHGIATDKNEIWELVKSLEQKGLTAKPQEFLSYIDTMTKAVEASGGKVTPAMFFSAFKYGRTSMLGWDETFIGQYLPRLIQSMSTGQGSFGGAGTGGPGNALMTAFQTVVRGQMNKPLYETWKSMGLLESGEKIPGTQSYRVGVTGRDVFMKNPYEWVQQFLMPKLAEHGITDQNRIIEQINRLFPVRTASQIISEMGLQGRTREGPNSPFEKDAAQARQALGLPGYDVLIKEDPTTVMKAFKEQWTSMIQTLGAPMVGQAIEMMKAFIPVFQSITEFGKNNPETIKLIGTSITALGAALTTGGGVAILAALGPAGWLTAGIVLLGAVIMKWGDKIPPILNTIRDLITIGIVTALSLFVKAIEGLKAPLDAVTTFIGSLIDKIKSWLPSLGNGKQAPDILGPQGGIQPMSYHPDAAQPGGLAGGAGRNTLGGRLLNMPPGTAPSSTPGGGTIPRSANVDIEHLNPEFRERIAALMANAPPGHKVISGYRSAALQAQLYARHLRGGPIAAPPGRSHHQHGLAADVHDPTGWIHRNAGRFGLHFPLGRRDWPHMEMMRNREPLVRRGGQDASVHHHHIHIDGRQVASVMTRHQANDAHRPAHGGQTPDYSRAFPQIA